MYLHNSKTRQRRQKSRRDRGSYFGRSKPDETQGHDLSVFLDRLCDRRDPGPGSGSRPAQPQADTATVGIIVTAQKRSESINNVGMAISALVGAGTHRRRRIADTGDLAKVVPGFVYTQSQKGAPVFSLRGVGFYEESLGASPAVSIYVDEVGYAFPITARGEHRPSAWKC
jgi:hypothetical protein